MEIKDVAVALFSRHFELSFDHKLCAWFSNVAFHALVEVLWNENTKNYQHAHEVYSAPQQDPVKVTHAQNLKSPNTAPSDNHTCTLACGNICHCTVYACKAHITSTDSVIE